MDRLYGIGNSGYDCMSFEMDKFLHQPRSCVSYDIPSYDMVAWIVKHAMYILYIVPRAGKTSNTLEVDFVRMCIHKQHWPMSQTHCVLY